MKKFWQDQVKRISIRKDSEIFHLAEELNVSLDSKAIRNVIGLGMKASYSDTQLEQIAKELEEKRKKIESDFQKIAVQTIPLEGKYMGTRNQMIKVYQDNRVLTMYLCARSPRNERKKCLRDRLIQKYIIDSKLT